MKVYHVYECFYEEEWYPETCDSRIYKDYNEAKRYFDSLVKEGIECGNGLDYQENNYAQFNTDDINAFKIFIDEYELR